ncbi:MAG: YihY/virulence factor BrkB family protein [Planctomycetes bacterium]|nr:YihY/virulence factor BrkB family protein [Planctomycetota bacterium]
MGPLPLTRWLTQSIRNFISRFFHAMREEDLGGIAAQMTYYFMLALFPTLILMVWVLDLLPLSGDMAKAVGRSFHGVSKELGVLIERYVEEFALRRPSGSLLLWAFAALWAASRGIEGARKGLDRVFRPERHRNFAKLKVVDLLITLFAILFVGLAQLLLLGGQQLAKFFVGLIGLEDGAAATWPFFRWPIAIIFLLIGVVMAYRYLPSRRLPYRYLFYGAVPTVLGWLALGTGFRQWLRSLGNFDRIYGSLASFFLLMFFLWLVSMCLLIGGQTAYVMAQNEGEEGLAEDGET